MTRPQAVLDCTPTARTSGAEPRNMNAVATADARAKTMPSTLTWSPATAPGWPRITSATPVSAAATAARRTGIGRTSPRIICQAAVSATYRYMNVAVATFERLIAANHVYCAAASPSTAHRHIQRKWPRGQPGRKTASSTKPPPTMCMVTSQRGVNTVALEQVLSGDPVESPQDCSCQGEAESKQATRRFELVGRLGLGGAHPPVSSRGSCWSFTKSSPAWIKQF